MEIAKIILTVKENFVGLKQTGTNEIKLHISKSDSSKVAALEAFNILMDSVDTNETISEVVAHIFLPDVIYKPFINGTIASYIREGKTRNGNELSVEELTLYNKAYDKYLLRAKNLVIRNSDFNALDKLQETSIKNEIRNCYSFLDKQIKKGGRQVIINNTMSDSTKASLVMLNKKLEEAIMSGDMDLANNFIEMIQKLESGSGVSNSGITGITGTIDNNTADNTEDSTDNNTENTKDSDSGFSMTIKKSEEKDVPAGLAAFMKLK